MKETYTQQRYPANKHFNLKYTFSINKANGEIKRRSKEEENKKHEGGRVVKGRGEIIEKKT